MYINGNDGEGHIRVLRFLLENGLIRKTKSGKLYDISFKYDLQTYVGKHKGSGFTGVSKRPIAISTYFSPAERA